MLELEPIEFFLRALPEAFILILAIYAFSNTKIEIKRYVIGSILCAIAIFIVRMLPISYGVHTILSMGIIILIGVMISYIDVIKSIKGILIVVILQFILEGANVFMIQNICKGDMNVIFSDPIQKTLYGIPSIIMLAAIIGGCYFIKNKKGELINA